jgi:hypothetical protein
MRSRLIRLIVAAAAVSGLGLASGVTGAHATTSIDKPTVTFGCGTVTVTAAGKSHTAHVLPCPGPVIF